MASALEVTYFLLLALGVGATLFATISLADGFRFWRRVRGALGAPSAFQPPAAVLIPVRGEDPDFAETVKALEGQEYPTYRLIFIIDPDDPAERRLRGLGTRPNVTIAHATPLPGCSGKIAALLTGLEHLEEEDQVLVFADSDILPDEQWLTHLVGPLEDAALGACTGYRWYFPRGPGLGPALQSAWNSAAGNVLFSPRWTYLWGGSYAIRRATFESVAIEDRWRRALSDDMVLTQALKAAGWRITFAPRATVANRTEGAVGGVVTWTHRQACLALLYAPSMSRLTLPYALTAGAALLALVPAALLPMFPPMGLALLLLLSPVYLGLVKGFLRRRAFREAMPAFRPEFAKHRLWFALATVLLPFIMLLNVRRARRMREFEWRGRVYRFASPEEITVVSEG